MSPQAEEILGQLMMMDAAKMSDTPAERERRKGVIRKMHAEGAYGPAMAEALNIEIAFVYKLMREMKLKTNGAVFHKLSPKERKARDDYIIKANADGRTNVDIAESIGVSAQTIHRDMKRLGLSANKKGRPQPPRFWDDAREKELCRLWGKGMSSLQISAIIGTTKAAIVAKAHVMGLSKRDR